MRRVILAIFALPFTACAGDGSSEGPGTATESPMTPSSEELTTPRTSESSTQPTSSATNSATGGDESSTGGTTTPSVGVTRGSVSFHVVPKGECSLGDTWIDFPDVGGARPVTAETHMDLMEDLTKDASGRDLRAICEWITSTEPYYISLSVSAESADDSRFLSMTAALSSQGPVDSSMTFQRSFSEPQWGMVREGELCSFSPIEVDMTNQSAWGSFVCPLIGNRDNADQCEITEGYFYFENCKPREL